MVQDKVKKVFPGGNTVYGFYSFYDYIIPPDARRIMVLKGGPGVGKSTFIKNLGQAMTDLGYDVEYHCCSSDNDSLDGLVVPAVQVAIIDGTTPHVVDPRNPGAVDEIIYLGDYWDEAALRQHKETVLNLNREISQLFAHAYRYLAQAKLLDEDIESYYSENAAADTAGLKRIRRELAAAIYPASGGGEVCSPGRPDRYCLNRPGFQERHLFASAITPAGCVNHFDTVFGGAAKRYLVSGGSRQARTSVITWIYQEAIERGFMVEAYHCGLNPDYLEHLLIPELDTAVISSVPPHCFPARPQDTVIDLDHIVDKGGLDRCRQDLDRACEDFRTAIDRAVGFIYRAKLAHDELEACYIPHMNFAGINARQKEVRQRLLAYTRESENEQVAAGKKTLIS